MSNKAQKLLLAIKKVKNKVLEVKKEEVSYYHLHKFDKEYDKLIELAYEENPLPEVTVKKHCRNKRSKY